MLVRGLSPEEQGSIRVRGWAAARSAALGCAAAAWDAAYPQDAAYLQDVEQWAQAGFGRRAASQVVRREALRGAPECRAPADGDARRGADRVPGHSGVRAGQESRPGPVAAPVRREPDLGGPGWRALRWREVWGVRAARPAVSAPGSGEVTVPRHQWELPDGVRHGVLREPPRRPDRRAAAGAGPARRLLHPLRDDPGGAAGREAHPPPVLPAASGALWAEAGPVRPVQPGRE